MINSSLELITKEDIPKNRNPKLIISQIKKKKKMSIKGSTYFFSIKYFGSTSLNPSSIVYKIK